MLLEPARGAAHHFHVVGKGAQIVVVCHMGGCKLDGNIRAAEGRRIKILEIVDVDNRNNLVTTFFCDFFYHMAHLAISNQCYFHLFFEFSAQIYCF